MEPNYIRVVQFNKGIKFICGYRNVMSCFDEYINEKSYKIVMVILLQRWQILINKYR